jgi:hypothetical protein
VLIPGTKKLDRLEQNIKAAEINLTPDDPRHRAQPFQGYGAGRPVFRTAGPNGRPLIGSASVPRGKLGPPLHCDVESVFLKHQSGSVQNFREAFFPVASQRRLGCSSAKSH